MSIYPALKAKKQAVVRIAQSIVLIGAFATSSAWAGHTPMPDTTDTVTLCAIPGTDSVSMVRSTDGDATYDTLDPAESLLAPKQAAFCSNGQSILDQPSTAWRMETGE